MEKMSILLVFFCFKLMFFSGRAFWVFELLRSQVHFLRELSLHAVLCRNGQRKFEHSENGMMGFVLYNPYQPSSPRKNNSIDLFCYKIYMFPHKKKLYKSRLVFSNRWILLLKINIHCPLSIFLYQKMTVFTWVDQLISDSLISYFKHARGTCDRKKKKSFLTPSSYF